MWKLFYENLFFISAIQMPTKNKKSLFNEYLWVKKWEWSQPDFWNVTRITSKGEEKLMLRFHLNYWRITVRICHLKLGQSLDNISADWNERKEDFRNLELNGKKVWFSIFVLNFADYLVCQYFDDFN